MCGAPMTDPQKIEEHPYAWITCEGDETHEFENRGGQWVRTK